MSAVRAELAPQPLHAPFLRADALLALLRQTGVPASAVVIDHVRLKRDAAIVGVSITGEDGRGPLQGYVRLFAPDRGRSLAQKWAALRPVVTPLGPGVRLLPGAVGVLFLFPNDHALRGVRTVLELDKLKRLLADAPGLLPDGTRISGRRSELSVVRYKPERRVIARARLAVVPAGDSAVPWRAARGERALFLRYFSDGRGTGLARLAEALRAAGFAQIPRPLGALLRGRLFVEEEVPGPEILPSVLEGRGDADALAAALLALHRVDDVPLHAVSAPGLGVARALTALAGVDPSLEERVGALRAALRRSLPAERVRAPIHGDLHLHQVVVGPSGPVLVDLERAGVGHPLQDLGDLVAHLDAIAVRDAGHADAVRGFRDRVVASYLAGSPSLSPRDLPFFVACGLVELALLAFRRQEAGWRDRSARLLEMAVTAAAGSRGAR